MKQVDYADMVNATINSFSKEIVENRVPPSLIDGLTSGYRGVVYGLADFLKQGKTKMSAAILISHIRNQYHEHSDASIYSLICTMAESKLPLIQIGKQGTSSLKKYPRDIDKGFASAIRYVYVSITEYGKMFIEGSLIAPQSRQFLGKPEYYASLIPNILFMSNRNFSFGLKCQQLPLNPKEVFRCMREMVTRPNFNMETDEIIDHIKSLDLRKNHIVICNKQSICDLVDKGLGTFFVLCPIKISDNSIVINQVPYGSFFNKVVKRLERLETNTENWETANRNPVPTTRKAFIRTRLQNIIITEKRQSHCRLELFFTRKPNVTDNDILEELYIKLDLLEQLTVSYIGLTPKYDSEGKPVQRRLHYLTLRQILQNCLSMGYQNRVAQINNEIEDLQGKLRVEVLLEKMSRPSTAKWFKEIYYARDRKERLFELANSDDENYKIADAQFGKLFIKGGLTWEDVEEINKEKGNNILARVNKRDEALQFINNYKYMYEKLLAMKTHENVISYLVETLESLIAQAPVRESKYIYNTTCKLDEYEQEDNMTTNPIVVDATKVTLAILKDGSMIRYQDEFYENNIFSNEMIPIEIIDMAKGDTLGMLQGGMVTTIKEEDIPSSESRYIQRNDCKCFYIANDIQPDTYAYAVTSESEVMQLHSNVLTDEKSRVGISNKDARIYHLFNITNPENTVEIAVSYGVKRLDLMDYASSIARPKNLFKDNTQTIDCKEVNKFTPNVLYVATDYTIVDKHMSATALIKKPYRNAVGFGKNVMYYLDDKVFFYKFRRISLWYMFNQLYPTMEKEKYYSNAVELATIDMLKEFNIENVTFDNVPTIMKSVMVCRHTMSRQRSLMNRLDRL